MSEFRSEGARDNVADAYPNLPSKCPRERLMTLHVEAEHCPHVFARILHLVTGQVLVPVDISLEKGAKRLVIDVLLDPVHITPSLWFLEQIEGLPAVKSAEYLDHRGRSLLPAPAGGEGERIAIGSLVDGVAARGQEGLGA